MRHMALLDIGESVWTVEEEYSSLFRIHQRIYGGSKGPPHQRRRFNPACNLTPFVTRLTLRNATASDRERSVRD